MWTDKAVRGGIGAAAAQREPGNRGQKIDGQDQVRVEAMNISPSLTVDDAHLCDLIQASDRSLQLASWDDDRACGS